MIWYLFSILKTRFGIFLLNLYFQAQFGTLSDYFNALRADLSSTQTNLPVLSGDFFSYADRDDHYWSGYFTSRPYYKRLSRIIEYHARFDLSPKIDFLPTLNSVNILNTTLDQGNFPYSQAICNKAQIQEMSTDSYFISNFQSFNLLILS